MVKQLSFLPLYSKFPGSNIKLHSILSNGFLVVYFSSSMKEMESSLICTTTATCHVLPSLSVIIIHPFTGNI